MVKLAGAVLVGLGLEGLLRQPDSEGLPLSTQYERRSQRHRYQVTWILYPTLKLSAATWRVPSESNHR